MGVAIGYFGMKSIKNVKGKYSNQFQLFFGHFGIASTLPIYLTVVGRFIGFYHFCRYFPTGNKNNFTKISHGIAGTEMFYKLL